MPRGPCIEVFDNQLPAIGVAKPAYLVAKHAEGHAALVEVKAVSDDGHGWFFVSRESIPARLR
jgi:hypothetical protein